MKKFLAIPALLLMGVMLLAANSPETPSNQIVSGTYAHITSTNAVTANTSSQSILVSSSSNCAVNGPAIFGDNPEQVQIISKADTTHFTAIILRNHAAGANIYCGAALPVAVSGTVTTTVTFPLPGGSPIPAASGQGVAIDGFDNVGGTNVVPLFASSNALNVAAFQGTSALGPGEGCDHSVAISVATATTAPLVNASSTKIVRVCGFTVMAAGTTSVTFEYGTKNTNECDTGPTFLSGSFPLTAQAGVTYGNGLGVIMQTAASNGLCIVNSANFGIAGILTYTQR